MIVIIMHVRYEFDPFHSVKYCVPGTYWELTYHIIQVLTNTNDGTVLTELFCLESSSPSNDFFSFSNIHNWSSLFVLSRISAVILTFFSAIFSYKKLKCGVSCVWL